MATTAIAPLSPQAIADISGIRLNREQIELLKRTIAKGTTDDEFAMFIATANRLGLDPFAKQIFAVKRYDSKLEREVMSIQISIDGFRSGATRTGEVDGQDGPYWCGEDGAWREVWTQESPPAAAKVLVYRKGCARPFTGVASYLSYVQKNRDGKPNAMWTRGPDFMLAKCAEALALRKAFPVELAGVNAPEEMGDEERTTFSPVVNSAVVATPSSPAPTKPAEPKRPALTHDDVVDIVAAFGRCMSLDELKKVSADRVMAATMTEEQRNRLAAAYSDQRDLIVEAERQIKAEGAS